MGMVTLSGRCMSTGTQAVLILLTLLNDAPITFVRTFTRRHDAGADTGQALTPMAR